MKILRTKNLWNSTRGRFELGNLIIDGAKISAFEFGEISATSVKKKILDLGALFIGPNAIDLHIHSRDFEESYKETFESLEAAALSGGVSVLACMANTRPRLDSVSRIQEFIKRSNRLRVRCIPFAAVTENLEGKTPTDWNSLLKMKIAGLSDDGKPILNAEIMKSALIATKRARKILSLHEEDPAIAKGSHIHLSEASLKLGLEACCAESESSMVERDLNLAEITGAPVHFGHISSAQSVSFIRKAKRKGLKVSAELTPHHGLLNVDDILKASMTERSIYKVCPVIRSEQDRQALLLAAADGSLDCFASDHAPHSSFEKNLPFDQAAHGIISLENHFSLYNEVRLGAKMTWSRYFSATSFRPAELLNLGKLWERGAAADFIVFDPEMKSPLKWSQSKSSNTPFQNKNLRGKIIQHWIQGNMIYES